MRAYILTAVLLLLPGAVQADRAAGIAIGQGCYRYTMCDAQTATGACTGTTEIVAELKTYTRYVGYATASTASTYSCDLFTSATGYDASAQTQVNTDAITEAVPVSGPLEGLLRYVWVECSAINADGNVSFELDACP